MNAKVARKELGTFTVDCYGTVLSSSALPLMIMWRTPSLPNSSFCKWKILKDIHLYINSPGGSVSDGMAIYDTLNFMQCDRSTTTGMAASMSTVLLAAGTPGKRYVLPNSRVMIHQPREVQVGKLLIFQSLPRKSLDGGKPSMKFFLSTAANPFEQWESIGSGLGICPPTKRKITGWLTK